MRFSNIVVALGCAVVMTFAASSVPLDAAPRRGFVTPATTPGHRTPVVYAITEGKGIKSVAVYNANSGALIRTISGFPFYTYTIATAPNGDLYVATIDYQPAKVRIYAFHAGDPQPFATIDERPGSFLYLAAAGNGELAVVRPGPGNLFIIDFFEPGDSVPTRTIRTKWTIFGEAYASDGTLWIAGLDPSVANAYGYVAAGSDSIVEVPFALDPPSGSLVIDRSGNIVVADKGRLIANSPQGQLAYIVSLRTRPRIIESLAFSSDGKRMFVCDPYSQLEAYDYPAGGRPTLVFGTYSTAIAFGYIPN